MRRDETQTGRVGTGHAAELHGWMVMNLHSWWRRKTRIQEEEEEERDRYVPTLFSPERKEPIVGAGGAAASLCGNKP